MSRPNELADCVRRSLERYFKDMDGEKPTSIRYLVWCTCTAYQAKSPEP